MPSEFCTANTATRRYRHKKAPHTETFYLECSDGWTQRLNAEGLRNFDQDCAKRGITYRIVDPVKVHIRDEIMILPVYEG